LMPVWRQDHILNQIVCLEATLTPENDSTT
jgi:hypothetical protein